MPFATRVVETHVSNVFFVGDRVFKLKKPVQTGFLDFTSREAREAACRREVALNRRLSPDVYLGVATVLDDEGNVADHLVVMRRMPDEMRLSRLVAAGVNVDGDLRDLARLIAAFHAGARRGSEIDEAATGDAVLKTWEAGFRELDPFVGSVLLADEFDRVRTLARTYIEGRGPLFERRIARGWARDGHGDLLADDIFCLPDGPRVLDCIEFDDHLRFADVLADCAFLVMDLERLGHPELGDAVLRWYGEFSGERHPRTLADHYIAARAHVRAKVACLRHEQGDAGSAAVARQLHRMTSDHLEQAQVRVALVGGLPGTGKSTLAAGLAQDGEWMVLRSDEIRKELAGLPVDRPAPAPFGEGLYSTERTEQTYAEMLVRARTLVMLGEPVVLDASWMSRRHRVLARAMARSVHAPLVELECVAPVELAAKRTLERAARGSDPSDANPAIVRALQAHREAWPEATPVDATQAPAAIRRHVAAALAQAASAA